MTKVSCMISHDLMNKAKPGREDVAKAVEEINFNRITGESGKAEVQFLKKKAPSRNGDSYDVECAPRYPRLRVAS